MSKHVAKKDRMLSVIEEVARGEDKRRRYICECKCGKIKEVSRRTLIEGRSCGCLRVKAIKEKSLTHGDTGKPEYNIWQSMKQRCDNPKTPAFENYGGRGITYDRGWSSYENFIRDMGYRDSKFYTLERVDNDGNYSKDNCIWACRDTQSLNKRNTVKVLYDGKLFFVKNLADIWGMTYSGAIKRIKRLSCKRDDLYILGGEDIE